MQQILKAEVLGANAGGRAGGVEDGSMGGKGDRALIFAMQTKAQRLHHMGRWCVEGQSRRGRVDKGFVFAIQARARGFHHRVQGALIGGRRGGEEGSRRLHIHICDSNETVGYSTIGVEGSAAIGLDSPL